MFNPNRTFIIAEAGINHNGSLELARKLVDVAVNAGCDAVKFQKRTPHMSLPPALWDVERDTPWGERMTYLAYRQKIELSPGNWVSLLDYCGNKNIICFASPWDANAAMQIGLACPLIKIASASVTNLELVEQIAGFGKPVIMSTGMCEWKDVTAAAYTLLAKLPAEQIGLLVTTSTYPAKPEDLNLARINALKDAFPECVIGYSGHETGLWTTLCAVAMGARIIERHITLDRSMPGTDQAASVEPVGLNKLVKEIRNFETALGSEAIRVLDCEQASIKRLRG
jgi:N-acetylneuraminate synthase